MPVEIRELIIKATIVRDDANSSGTSSTASNGNNASGSESIIESCVEKVLEIIKEKNGR